MVPKNILSRIQGAPASATLASPEKVFAMLTVDCAATSRHSGVTLLNYDDKLVRAAVWAMEEVKATGEYPHMAAAKFLHFYNPLLFPLYDNAVIWNRVLSGTFKREWKNICDEYGIKFFEPSEQFLITYFAWASEVMQSVEPDMMATFAGRFQERAGGDIATPTDVGRYYAAAFEYLLMGAAYTA